MLKKIVVHGFKSFCNRTEITLGSGITAIVGPNGCGKSNLADALRWVLGEQNPRVLRCNRLEELIFTGTQKRKAMGMAEVRLLLDGILDGTEKELVRRFTRDGSSEYRINGKVCRWKDVVEALLGTGLSHTGYVVIGQGMIQELAGGRPEDRKTWIEEASGVARFRLNKKDIEKKLSEAKANIVRLDDLLVELSARKAKLESDQEITRQYRSYSAQRRKIELAMWLYEEREEARRVQNLTKRLERYQNELEATENALKSLKKDVGPLSERSVSLKELVKRLTAERETLVSKLLELEKKRDLGRGKIALVTREIETRTAREKVIEKEIRRIAEEEESLRRAKEEISQKFDSAVVLLEEAQRERDSSESSWKELGEKVIDIRTETVSLTKKLGNFQKAREEVRRTLEEKRKELISVKSWLASAKEQISRQKEELRFLRRQLEKAEDRWQQARTEFECLGEKVKNLRFSLSKLTSSEKSIESRLSQVRARYRFLEDMERAYEGYGRGPKTILQAKNKGLLQGIIGSVGELFSCDSSYIPALSAAVGGAAENIVVRDENAAKEAIEFLKKAKSGRCTFLPLTLIRPRRLHPKAVSVLDRQDGVRPLLSVIKYPENLKNCAAYLFGRVVLADTIDHALAFMKASSWTTRTVTMSGETIEPGGAMSGGEVPRHEAIFQRKQEMKLFRSEERRLEQELEKTLTKKKALEEQLSDANRKYNEAREEMTSAESQVVRLRDSISRLERLINSVELEMRERSEKIPPLESSERQCLEDLDRLLREEKDISDRISEKEALLSEYEEKLKQSLKVNHAYSERIQKLSQEKERLERELSSLTKREQSLAGEKTSLEKNLVEERKEIARLESLRHELIQEDTSLEKEIQFLDRRVFSLKENISQAEEEIDGLLQCLSGKRQAIEKLERKKNVLENKIEYGKADLKNLESSLSEIRQFILKKFGLENPSEYEHERIPKQEAMAKIEEIDNRMKLLGTVNLKVEEEYKEVCERIEFIDGEKKDVEEAIDELQRTRKLLDQEIHNRFVKTFNLIAQSFEDIFKELFGGGRGKLKLVEGNLGVEVIAEPPGRRQKQFNLLSGGERSLCGIALIFSILSVRPSPLIVLDEVDTALDEANVVRFAQFLKRYSKETQFVVITHQETTMEVADIIYGVTMEEPGVSKVFGMRLENR